MDQTNRIFVLTNKRRIEGKRTTELSPENGTRRENGYVVAQKEAQFFDAKHLNCIPDFIPDSNRAAIEKYLTSTELLVRNLHT